MLSHLKVNHFIKIDQLLYATKNIHFWTNKNFIYISTFYYQRTWWRSSTLTGHSSLQWTLWSVTSLESSSSSSGSCHSSETAASSTSSSKSRASGHRWGETTFVNFSNKIEFYTKMDQLLNCNTLNKSSVIS